MENPFEEIMTQNFCNLVKEKDTEVLDTLSPNIMNPKRLTPIHVIIKMIKIKDRILKLQEKDTLLWKRELP